MSLSGAARLGALTGLLNLTTCVGFLYVSRPLTPPPTPACLQAALTASPRVNELVVLPAEDGGATYRLRIHDPEARDSIWMAAAHLDPAPASSGLVTISFRWSGNDSPRNRAEAQRLQRLAAALLTEVTVACAPGTTAPITCTQESSHPLVRRRSGPCAA